MSNGTGRFCPQCEAKTTERLCPADGIVTLMQHPPTFDLDKDAKVGLVVDRRYRLDRELGRGGFGAVFAARHTGTGAEVAIKLLSAQGELQQQRRFFREARVTAAMKSRHTIRVIDFGQDDQGLSYLAMELLKGRTVDAWLEERNQQHQALSEAEAIDVAMAVCKSLGEAHAAGLVHRDMKPQNLFCAETEDGIVVKVLDFGIVKVNDQNMTGDSIIGTTNYMSPEQAMSQSLDGRSDLYSLGVVLFELVSARLPFESETPVQTLVMHIQQAPPPLAKMARVPLGAAFLAIVDRCLAKQPNDRFADANEMLAALTAARPDAHTEIGGREGAPAGPDYAEDATIAAPSLASQRLSGKMASDGDATQYRAPPAAAATVTGKAPPMGFAPAGSGVIGKSASASTIAAVGAGRSASQTMQAAADAETVALDGSTARRAVAQATAAASEPAKPAANKGLLIGVGIAVVAIVAAAAVVMTSKSPAPAPTAVPVPAAGPAPVPAAAPAPAAAPVPAAAAAPAPVPAAAPAPAAAPDPATAAPAAGAPAAGDADDPDDDAPKAAEPASAAPAHKAAPKKPGGNALHRDL